MLERVLRKIAEAFQPTALVEPSLEFDEEAAEQLELHLQHFDDEASRIARQAISQIEEISFDSKLDAFAKL